jgi:hypothetical protein
MTTALARNKHVYGQKPLVQQLEELDILGAPPRRTPESGHADRRAAHRARRAPRGGGHPQERRAGQGHRGPRHLRQRRPGRRVLLRRRRAGRSHPPPAGFNYDLWLNGVQEEPCRPQMVQRQWRSWWNFGGGQIADWVVHLTDVLFYAFPELTRARCRSARARPRATSSTSTPTSVTLDPHLSSQQRQVRQLHLQLLLLRHRHDAPTARRSGWAKASGPAASAPSSSARAAPSCSRPKARSRSGARADDRRHAVARPARVRVFNHWHAWVDKALGKDTPHRWMPVRRRPALHRAGAARGEGRQVPGPGAQWDRAKLVFTNHAEATKTIVRREYRKGFEPASQTTATR